MRVATWQSSSAGQQRKLLTRPALAKDSNLASSVASTPGDSQIDG